MDKEIYIYGLLDPRDNMIKYIGSTGGLKQRMSTHIQRANQGRDDKKSIWIKELIDLNFKPKHRIIFNTTESQRYTVEDMFIKHYAQFCQLTNMQKTGIEFMSVKNKKKCSQRFSLGRNPSTKKRKSLIQYSMDGKIIREWESTTEVERSSGIDRAGISRACRGIYKTYQKFIWKYK